MTEALKERAALWRRAVDGPARFARQAALLVALVGVALLARPGTDPFRAAALIACLALLGLFLTLWAVRRGARDALRLVRQVIVPTDRELGERALRATRLVERTEGGPEDTAALAEYHLRQLIGEAPHERVEAAARRRALRYRLIGATLAGVTLVAAVWAHLEIAEGLNVLATSGSTAPVPMQWTRRLRLVAQPPAYLHQSPRRLAVGASAILPLGTRLTLRARPLHSGRQLVVSDGAREVGFVSDGEGGLVAHYAVEGDAELRVAARFGEVLIVEPRVLRVVGLPDNVPRVTLEGAPKTIPASQMDRLELRWWAVDDHGLEQVDLVLRSGNREERRTLSRYDGEPGFQQGGYALSPTDPFLRRLYVPAEIRIEARDNDPSQGNKWGRSEAIVIVPSPVGAPETARYLALVRARDRFVDALAAVEAARRDPQAPGFRETLDQAARGLENDLSRRYDGLTVSPGLRSFALGRLRLVTDLEGPAERFEQPLGELILGLDSALAALSRSDAGRVARVLAEVAEEAMVGAELCRSAESSARGEARLDEALVALSAGIDQLLSLGTLGNDLGSVARADSGRVTRAREAGDYFHAQLAARHLADRLRRPLPSFGSSSGGVEAGRSGSQQPSQHPSQAPDDFDRLARQIAELARQHADALDGVDQALSEAQAQAAAGDDLREEAERRASELRDAVDGLPLPGHPPGSKRAEASLGREHARAMAHGMESLAFDEAVESARRALSSLEKAREQRSPGADRLDAHLDDARQTVARELEWLEQRQREASQMAKEQARESLAQSASLEDELAQTARSLAQRGTEGETPLPADVTERLAAADQLMQRAADALRRGEGEAGSKLQRDAQRLLERADHGETRSGPGAEQALDDGEGLDAFGGEVPEADEVNDAEAFRRRVIRNLGENPTGELAPAIRRYAEGLLR